MPVGVAESDRLRQVFALQPDVAGDEPDQTRRRLRVWLRALLVKSSRDRATFERIYVGLATSPLSKMFIVG